jgi:protein-disulfide isomerase
METENLMSKKERDLQKAGSRRIKSLAYWLVGALILIATLGLVFYSVQNKNQVEDTAVKTFSINADDHTLGNKDSKVVLIEYSDLQCPSCKAYAPVLEQVVAEYGDRILFVYRHFPLTQIHFASIAASTAVESADNQGKFWEMQKIIFENQDTWAKAGATEAEKIFIGYAGDLGLDVAKFTTDLKSEAIQAKITADLTSGREAGVDGTPSFFLNGKKIAPRSLEAFQEELNKAIIDTTVDNLNKTVQ